MLRRQTLFSTWKKRVFRFILERRPFLLPGLSHFPVLHSLSLSLLLFPGFLPSFFSFLLSSFLVYFSVFLSWMLLFLLLASFLCLCLMPRRTSTLLHLKGCSHQLIIGCLGFLFLFCLSNPLLLFLHSPVAPTHLSHLNIPFLWRVFFCGVSVAFDSCVGFMFVDVAWFVVGQKCPKKGELAHYSPLLSKFKKICLGSGISEAQNLECMREAVLRWTKKPHYVYSVFDQFDLGFWGHFETKLRVTPLSTWELAQGYPRLMFLKLEHERGCKGDSRANSV